MNPRFETLAVHGWRKPALENLAVGTPVYRNSSYAFKNADHAADLFALKESGYIYTRMGNPTQTELEERVALLESCGLREKKTQALALASGSSAIFYSVINLARQGDEIVAAANLYGGTCTMLDTILPQFGIKTRLIPSVQPEELAKAITQKTRAVYVEAIGNPVLDVPDIAALADMAHAHGLPLLVDATFATPWLLRPLEHGADIVIHSLTKWIGGHGTAIGGIVVDGGSFDWKDERFALYNEPDESYHGLRWGHDTGALLPFVTRMRTVTLRNLGACISPDNAWIFLQGISTLPLRMERHCANALAVAEYLEAHPKVSWVRYPGLSNDPAHELARRYLPRGGGGVVVFGLKGDGKKNGLLFVEGLSLFSHLANVGDARSLALHPASTTHSQLSAEQQNQAGVSPDLIRLSLGLEHKDDIIDDLERTMALI